MTVFFHSQVIDSSIGQDSSSNSTNPSVTAIKLENQENSFSFKNTTSDVIQKKLSSLDPHKSTGYDGIPNKILKTAAAELAPPLTSLINRGITSSAFPTALKQADVSPVFKRKDPMDK